MQTPGSAFSSTAAARLVIGLGQGIALHLLYLAAENGDWPATLKRGVADQVNALGDVDAVIYNAAVGPDERQRIETADGLSHVFEINVLAPYILTALIARPRRVVYLTSGLHRGGDPRARRPPVGASRLARVAGLQRQQAV